jgi:methyl-accepting chemotaxis protein
MLKNLRMALKMALGFGLLTLFLIIVGAIAVINLLQIQTDSIRLRDEYVTEVEIANNIERFAQKVMYEMRGYGFSLEGSFYTAAQEARGELLDWLAAAEDLAAQYEELAALANNVEIASAAEARYAVLARPDCRSCGYDRRGPPRQRRGCGSCGTQRERFPR